MTDIDINTGLTIKADINKLYGDTAGLYAKFKENRSYNKVTYDELLDKYGNLISEIENIRNKTNELVDMAQSNKLPDEQEVKAMDDILGLVGAKKQDGSLDLQKLMELNEAFGDKEAQ